MSNLIKIGIHETGEIFDSRVHLAKELEINVNTLGNYTFGRKPWNGLTFYQIKPSKFDYVCRKCGCLLNESNSKQYMFDNGDYICNDCLRKWGKEQNRKYRKKHPFQIKLNTLRQNCSGIIINIDDLNRMWNKQKGTCNLCGDKLNKYSFHIDHTIAKSKGGESSINNFQFLCEKCNRGKFIWTTKEYIEHCKKIVKNN